MISLSNKIDLIIIFVHLLIYCKLIMYLELGLVLIQLCGIALNLYYKSKANISVKQFLTNILVMCIYLPINEEILFRYAFYHLLEKYMSDTLYINIVNGLVFGLIHIPNITVLNFPNPIIFMLHIITNIYFGYYMATIHDDLVRCMLIHAMYNFIGVTITFVCSRYIYKAKKGVLQNISDKVYITRAKLRRCNSFDSYDYDVYDCVYVGVDKSKMNKDVLGSIEKYKEQQNIIRCKFEEGDKDKDDGKVEN